jgi:hypothetical protein
MGADPSRRLVYSLLIIVAVGAVAGRILAVGRVYEPWLFRAKGDVADTRADWPASRPHPMATLGANDRSRWDTIRALVDNGTYIIGHRDPAKATAENKFGDEGIIRQDGWETIDKVLRPDSNDFYSSKPPLLPTMLAGEYWLLKHGLGWSITDANGLVVRVILFTVNWLPFLVYLVLLVRLAERLGSTDWSRFYVVAAGAFATFLTPFVVTLSNHSVATCTALFALYSALQVWGIDQYEEGWWIPGSVADHRGTRKHLVLAGFFAGLTACTELPAASLAVALYALLLLKRSWATLLFYVPAAAVPVAGFFVTNYVAIGKLSPAYSEVHGPWYQYEGSYWSLEPGKTGQGIDWAGMHETKADYAFHLLLGHHGLFSLSPIFLLSVAGVAIVAARLVRRDRFAAAPASGGAGTGGIQASGSALGRLRGALGAMSPLTLVAGLCLLLTLTVVCFYIYKSDNYGGWTSGPRWLMWLTPFLLLTMLPCLDWLAPRAWGRVLGLALLGLSVLSVSYPAWNPWRHPWLYDFFQSQGWISY